MDEKCWQWSGPNERGYRTATNAPFMLFDRDMLVVPCLSPDGSVFPLPFLVRRDSLAFYDYIPGQWAREGDA